MSTYNTADLPYLYETVADWQTLPNGVARQIGWVYRLTPVEEFSQIDDDIQSIVVEQVARRLTYSLGQYTVVGMSITEWRYVMGAETYAAEISAYRGYWDGAISSGEAAILQPEVAILLTYTNDIQRVPPFIETLPLAELERLIEQGIDVFSDDDALAFSRPVPIGIPKDAPPSVDDALRRMRMQTKLKITRGRAALLDLFMKKTGVEAFDGGWRLLPDEIERRKGLLI